MRRFVLYLILNLLIGTIGHSFLLGSEPTESEKLQDCAMRQFEKYFAATKENRRLNQVGIALQHMGVLGSLDEVSHVASRAFVEAFPAEWLLWADVMSPLQQRDFVPDFAKGFEPVDGEECRMTVYIEYSNGQYPVVQNRHSFNSAKQGLQEIPEAFFASKAQEVVWIRDNIPTANCTRAVLLVCRGARMKDSNTVGTLKTVQFTTLRKSSAHDEYAWELDSSQVVFVPNSSTKQPSTVARIASASNDN